MDSSEMIRNLCREGVPLNSERFNAYWSKIQESSSFRVYESLDCYDWEYLMTVLAQADVSRIRNLALVYPKESANVLLDILDGCAKPITDVGSVLGTGRFAALKSLRVTWRCDSMVSFVRQKSLVEALSKGQLKNLRELTLSTCNVGQILGALMKGQISQLRSFSAGCYEFYRVDDDVSKRLDEVLKSGYFRSLVFLDLPYHSLDGWKVITEAISSGLLPNIKALWIRGSVLHHMDLADLVGGIENSFSSLEHLKLDCCYITSEQVCAMVDAIMKTKTGLTLKRLDLHDNLLKENAVDALVSLACSDHLLQLEKLDLSRNRMIPLTSLVSLIDTIEKGHLPSFKSLNWKGNWGGEANADVIAEFIVQSYFRNEALTAEFDIDWHLVKDLSLETKANKLRDRNVRLVALKEKFTEELADVVPLTSSKVFLCGYPEVGKTRLRRSLRRDAGLRTKLKWETRPQLFKEPRTRGIELSRINEKKQNRGKFELVLWDLAGQEEYHVLHGTFLADLGFAGGIATTFILVFQATFRSEVKDELLSWLRFVASSSQSHIKRHVVIVLNCFDGKQCTSIEKKSWMGWIRKFATLFSDLLDICLDPFIMDVRVAASVKPLRDHLFTHAQEMLVDVRVPRLCFVLHEEFKGWSKVTKNNHLPIFTWEAFRKGSQSMHVKHSVRDIDEKALKGAAGYLHEIGQIIYFEDKKPEEQGSQNRGIIAPDPEWFCKEVVGQLLLPKEMLDGDNCLEVGADGSISIERFRNYFEDLLIEGTTSDDVISMLERLGLCYRKGREEIVVPALIREDDYSQIGWEGEGFHGVMGRSLATEDKERFAIPMTLFRRLQVELAQDRNYGGRGDSEYKAGKFFTSFKVGELLVLIEFDVDPSNPIDDRIDILAKSTIRDSGDPTEVRLALVKCISEIVQKLQVLCVSCCPGVKYDIKVIMPWKATEKTPGMIERRLMSLREIKDLLLEGMKYSSWRFNGNPMELQCFFSENELKDVMGMKTRASEGADQLGLSLEVAEENENPDLSSALSGDPDVPSMVDETTEDPNVSSLDEADVSVDPNHSLPVTAGEKYDACKQLGLTFGFLTEDSLKNLNESDVEDDSNALSLVRERNPAEYENNDRQGFAKVIAVITEQNNLLMKTVLVDGHLTRQIVREDGHRTRQLIDKRLTKLMLEVQAQQAFSIEEQGRSVPRYMFLARKQGKSRVWMRLKEAFGSTFELHLLCEALFDDGCVHEVKHQDGIELKKPKEWLVKVSPWLRRSLQVAVMVGTTVGNIYLPGVFSLIPELKIPEIGGEDLSKAVDRAATMLLDEDEGPNQTQAENRNQGTSARPVDLKERMIAEQVVEELRSEVGRDVFAKKIGLRRVLLGAKVRPDEGSSKQAEPSVLWICHECYKKYKAHPEKYKIHDITP